MQTTFLPNCGQIASMASVEFLFVSVNREMDGQMDDGQKVITIAHPEHSSGELTM